MNLDIYDFIYLGCFAEWFFLGTIFVLQLLRLKLLNQLTSLPPPQDSILEYSSCIYNTVDHNKALIRRKNIFSTLSGCYMF